MFAEPVPAPQIVVSSQVCQPGTPLQLDLQGFSKGTVLRVEVLGPDGTPVLPHPNVLCLDGTETTHPLHFAHNWPLGAYELVVRDVRSALTSTVTLDLQKDGSDQAVARERASGI